VLTQKIGSKFTVYAQGDFGSEDFTTAVGAKTVAADWYAGGLWGVYQFTDKVGVAVRGDYCPTASPAVPGSVRR